MKFELQELGYDYNALEPYIDAETMEIHHKRHHGGYTDKLNAAINEYDLPGIEIKDLLNNVSDFSAAIRNNGGGYYNHNLFWRIMSPNGGGEPDGELMDVIKRDFNSYENFKNTFETAAATRFGSGWAWLIKDDEYKLKVCSTPNQDNPLMDVSECKGVPILGLDVWEHAYYLKYQNKRPDYINAFWNVVDWKAVGEMFRG